MMRHLLAEPTPSDRIEAEGESAFNLAASAGLFVGITRFKDELIAEVPFAVDDAVDLAHVFALELGLLLPRRTVLLLAGEPKKPESINRLAQLVEQGARRQPAQASDVYSYLDELTRSTEEQGLFVFTASTHGISDQGGDFLVATDSVRRHMLRTGVAIGEVLDEVARAGASRQIMLLDACRERLSEGTRGQEESPMAQSFAAAIAHSKGTVVLSGATLGGFAYDDYVRKNGVFTAAVLDGLRGEAPAGPEGWITVSTLADFAEQRVVTWIHRNRPDHAERALGISRKIDGTATNLPLVPHPNVLRKRQEYGGTSTSASPSSPDRPPPGEGGDSSQIGTVGEPIEPSETRRSWSRLLVGLSALIAVLLMGFVVWQGHVQSRKTDLDRCLGVFDALAKLDDSYGYGSCSLSEDTDDDSRLAERIEPVLRRAEGCDAGLADQPRIDFYRNVQKDLRGDASACKSPEKDEQEGVWFRFHCLQRRSVDSNPPVTVAGAADWASLAGEFETLVPKTSESARGPLQNCAAISRATAYRSLAAITGRPEATDHMIVAAQAIKKSEEVHIALLVSKGLAEYRPMVRRPFNDNELKTANKALDLLLGQEGNDEKEEAALWGHILPSAHRHVQLAALGVVVDHMAQSRSKSPEEEKNYLYYCGRLESGLRNAVERDKTLAADFLFAKRETMKDGWYQATVLSASTDCEHGAADRQRSGAVTLESMRAIYGWWAQTKLDLSTEQWTDLQKQGPPWLNWWSLQDEVTTTLCSLATDLIGLKEAKRRLVRVLELPEGGGLCYSAQTQRELWQAGTKKLPWLRDMVKEKCPS